MKKNILYTTILALYIATPLCILGMAGTMVSLKYEVEHSYWIIDENRVLKKEEKLKEMAILDSAEQKLKIQAYALGFAAITAFTIATFMLIRRNKFIP